MERRSPFATFLVHCAAFLLGMFILAPLVWLFVMSISSTQDLTAKPLHWWPQTIDFSRYRTLVTVAANSTGQAFLASLRNSLTVAALGTIGGLLVAVPAGWAVSRNVKIGWSLYAVIATYMLPPVARDPVFPFRYCGRESFRARKRQTTLMERRTERTGSFAQKAVVPLTKLRLRRGNCAIWFLLKGPMAESRKLAAILCSDVVGFSRLARADEDRVLVRLRSLRSDLIDPTIAVHSGRVVKRTGDGSIVEFRSAVDAVRSAI